MKKNGFPDSLGAGIGSILWESRLEQRQTTFIVSPQPQTLPKIDPRSVKMTE